MVNARASVRVRVRIMVTARARVRVNVSLTGVMSVSMERCQSPHWSDVSLTGAMSVFLNTLALLFDQDKVAPQLGNMGFPPPWREVRLPGYTLKPRLE